MIDYFLKSAPREITLEIFDARQNLVRRFSSEDSIPAKRPPMPIAERWFPKPAVLEKAPGMHRFVWNFAWNISGGPSPDEESEYRSPSGPKAVPGNYQVRLTIDGRVQSQPLQIVMDPRSSATQETLEQQLQIGKEIYDETLEIRRALAEIASLQKQLSDLQQKAEAQPSGIKSALSDAQQMMQEILAGKKSGAEPESGLQEAYAGVTAALRVVESGDRAVPSQAIALYQESSQQAKARIADWTKFKQTKLPQLNQKLHDGNLAPIAISEIEQTVESAMSR